MPELPWEDIDAFLQPADFAALAQVALQDGGGRALLGIFDAPYYNAELGEYDFDSQRPRFTCKAADAVAIHRGDILTLGTASYDVLTEPQGDGAGMAVLELAERPSD